MRVEGSRPLGLSVAAIIFLAMATAFAQPLLSAGLPVDTKPLKYSLGFFMIINIYPSTYNRY